MLLMRNRREFDAVRDRLSDHDVSERDLTLRVIEDEDSPFIGPIITTLGQRMHYLTYLSVKCIIRPEPSLSLMTFICHGFLITCLDLTRCQFEKFTFSIALACLLQLQDLRMYEVMLTEFYPPP